MKIKSRLEVPDELVDAIVDEILTESQHKKSTEISLTEAKFLDDDSPKIKSRLQNLENRIEKHVHDYKTTAIEVERQIVDKFSEFDQENEKRLIYLQGQLEALREAMIRLSNEFRKSKESISSQKQ